MMAAALLIIGLVLLLASWVWVMVDTTRDYRLPDWTLMLAVIAYAAGVGLFIIGLVLLMVAS